LYPETGDWLYNHYLNFFLPQVLKKATKIVTISENSKRDLLSFFPLPPAKVEVIYLAADPSFHPVDDQRLLEKVREKYGIRGPFILNVNVLEPRKNIQSLLSAYALLKKSKMCPHRLVIAGGKGWGYQKLFEQATHLRLENDVLFIGHVPDEDLNVLYNLADVFVFPTLYEGFGLPVLEAMACGCPVVASRRASLPEVVGDAGILFDPLDIKGLASLLDHVLSCRAVREELRGKSLQRARMFSWEKAATQTKELFENIYRGKT
jgi:glycosyltransferase involved in cell wall biosynthesis